MRLKSSRTGAHGHCCPCFPSPLHSFHTVGFPQYGWKTAFAEVGPSPQAGLPGSVSLSPGPTLSRGLVAFTGNPLTVSLVRLCLPSHRPLARRGLSCPHLQTLLRPDAPV